MVILDGTGKEIDRIVGYRPPEEMVVELNRILRNEGTIGDLQAKVKSDPNNVDYWQQLAAKFEDRNDLESARDIWETISELTPDLSEEARYHVAAYSAQIDGTITRLESFIREYPESRYIQNAYYAIVKHYQQSGDIEKEVASFRQLADFIVTHKLKDPNSLNSYSWRMAELERNLDDALVKVRLAENMVSQMDNQTKAQIMDTEAEVLWKMGRVDEAVTVINKCISLQPEDEYYIRQKNKFTAAPAS